MAFEKLAPYIDIIEQGFQARKSPRVIANELGQPGLYSTINRYKAAVWGMKDLVGEAKEKRAEKHDARREATKVEIIASLDLIEKMKARAFRDLDWQAGDEYDISGEDGKPSKRKVTPGQAIAWHDQAANVAAKALRAELELSGDAPSDVSVTVKNEININDVLKEYYGAEDASGSANPEGNDPGQSVHSAQTDSEASPISD